MQSNFEMVDIGNQQLFMDSNSCSSVLPIFNPPKPNHHQHFHHQLQQQQTEPSHHISHLFHPSPITHDLFQRQNHFPALQQQEEQQGRFQWQLNPVNFKLGLNENSGNGENALLGAGLLGENAADPRLLQSRPTHNLGFKSWQTQDYYGIRKEPMCWKQPLDADTNKKQRQDSEGEICKELESRYMLYGELEAIYSLAKMGQTNQMGSGGSALTGENSPKNLDLPVVLSDPHVLNAAPTANVRVDNGSEPSIGEEVLPTKMQKRKRKKKVKEQLSSMTGFFEGLVKKVMDHQESLHNKYLEVVERMDKERREREAAWRCQEAENRKSEAIAKHHEQALASSREALIVSYIEKITGQRVYLPCRETPLSLDIDNLYEPVEKLTPSKIDHTISKWPQSEVEALILVRSSIESKFQEPGLKGPIWEEVSALMASIGFQRSAKRCKEKWENINKYFRKTKDSATKRPHRSKTCSYFNQLDQLYSKTPIITVPSSSTSYYPSKPSVSMDDGIQRQGYTDLLEALIAGREAGVTHNLSNGNFEISNMGSSRLDLDGIVDSKLEHVQRDHGKENANQEDNESMDEKEDTDSDDSDE